jgi:hypothetical protein
MKIYLALKGLMLLLTSAAMKASYYGIFAQSKNCGAKNSHF